MTRIKLINIHSNVYQNGAPKAPDNDTLEKGEIAVNYNDTEPALFIVNNSGNVVKFNAVQRSEITGITNNNKVNLNGTENLFTGTTWSFYAPTSSGATNSVLLSNGQNNSPVWAAQSAITAGNSTKINGYNLQVVTQIPDNPDPNTIYILK